MNEAEITADRAKFTDAIVRSSAQRKLIVAGAGCGKSYTFNLILADNASSPSDALVMTFINTLVDDLRKSLGEKAEVKTFHSLAHHLLRRHISNNYELYENLEEIIIQDFVIQRGETRPVHYFYSLFQNLNENEDMQYFLERSNYYSAVSHDDTVYRVLKKSEEAGSLVKKKTLIIDEFQDFNLLEVSFIEKVIGSETKVFAGDDDQAIYENLRNSSPEYIRKLSKDSAFETFPLPYCTRCPEVIVGAVHNVVDEAKKIGLFSERIDKDFKCFYPKKIKDNEVFSKIIHSRCSTNTKKCPYIGRYIKEQLEKIPEEETVEMNKEGHFGALIIGDKHYLTNIAQFFDSQAIPYFPLREKESENLNLTKALAMIGDNPTSRLGWRIVIDYKKPTNYEAVINGALKEKDIHLLLNDDYQNRILAAAIAQQTLLQKDEITSEQWEILMDIFSLSEKEIALLLFPQKIEEQKIDEKWPTIKFSSHVGAKGLSAGRVFIVSFNDEQLPRDASKITEAEVCMFIVGLTRTVKQCYLVSNKGFAGQFKTPKGSYYKESTFKNWLDPDILEEVYVDKEYFPKEG